jgi:hypothetical protein
MRKRSSVCGLFWCALAAAGAGPPSAAAADDAAGELNADVDDDDTAGGREPPLSRDITSIWKETKAGRRSQTCN